MPELILASTSVRRKAALKQIGAKFKVVPSQYEEDMSQDVPVANLVEFLALGKALAVAEKYPDAVVVGCDSLVVMNGQIFSKPKDMAEARQQISQLQGQPHDFISGYAIVHKSADKKMSSHTISHKNLMPMTDAEIDAYLDEGEPLGKAGSYSSEGKGIAIMQGNEGPYDLGGFPVAQIVSELKSFGINLITGNYNEA